MCPSGGGPYINNYPLTSYFYNEHTSFVRIYWYKIFYPVTRTIFVLYSYTER